MKILKTTILSAAVVATTLTTIPAEAGDRWRHHRSHRVERSDSDLVAAGILGLAIGALAAGVVTSNRGPFYGNPYRHPRPRPSRDHIYDHERVVIIDEVSPPNYEPWSQSWFRYCERRYRTFDAESGTFMGSDGREHFCVVR